MNFGQALDALKEGKKVARAEWQHENHKNVFLILVPGQHNIAPREGSPYANAIDIPNVCIDSHIDKYTGTSRFQPGWMPTQADMLADDWEDASEYTAANAPAEPESKPETATDETAKEPVHSKNAMARFLESMARIHKDSGVPSDVTGAVQQAAEEHLTVAA